MMVHRDTESLLANILLKPQALTSKSADSQMRERAQGQRVQRISPKINISIGESENFSKTNKNFQV